jgi:hypothetical protein
MEEIKNKIKKLIDEDKTRFIKNYIDYKLEVDKLDSYSQIKIWINNNKSLFNIYFKQDLEVILLTINNLL